LLQAFVLAAFRFCRSAVSILSQPLSILSIPSGLFLKETTDGREKAKGHQILKKGDAMTKEFGRLVAAAAVKAPAKRALSVVKALEWAFAVERVSLDFDDLRSDFARPGCDTIWRLMQRGALGCKVDGGGHSARHDDAEVIASMVAALPVALGGRAMADSVARLARSGSVPDWMPDARLRCVVAGWRDTKHGRFARTEVVERIETVHRGRKIVRDVVACPVDFYPKPAHVAAARRGYQDWCLALLHLQTQMRAYGLRTIAVTSAMPARRPWGNG
jgi:hypothetical protein